MFSNNKNSSEIYHLATSQKIPPLSVPNVGSLYLVNNDNFPGLGDITCYTLEVWEECMRLPHWHPNAAELGYVVSGTIEVILWRSPGETSMFTLSAGMCWFIPQAALHSLNNVGAGKAQLLVGFSSGKPQDIDLPVAFNGVPIPIRDAYTTPHAELRRWHGVIKNPIVGKCPVDKAVLNVVTGSPYSFNLQQVPPLFYDKQLGSVVWGVKSNWDILQNISVLHAHLKPAVARDAIWYPDAGTLYVVAEGKAEFHIIIADQTPIPIEVALFDYIYVPAGVLHTFMNKSNADFRVTAFFTKEDPQPEVSLAIATAFFPNAVRKAAMTQYANVNIPGDPLQHLTYTKASPYLLPLQNK